MYSHNSESVLIPLNLNKSLDLPEFYDMAKVAVFNRIDKHFNIVILYKHTNEI